MAVRSGDDGQVCLRLLQRLASARRAIIGIYFPPIPWPMTLSPTTEAIRVKSCGKKPLVLGKKFTDMMGRCHLRCKNRTLLLCSVSLLRVGDKFAFFIEFTSYFYFIYFILLLIFDYCPKLGQFFTKWCYSPDYVFILSDLVPH